MCVYMYLQVHKVSWYLPDMLLVAFLGVISKEESSFKFTSLENDSISITCSTRYMY